MPHTCLYRRLCRKRREWRRAKKCVNLQEVLKRGREWGGGTEPKSYRRNASWHSLKGHPERWPLSRHGITQSEAAGLLRGQSFRKEGERKLVAEPRPWPAALKCRTLNPACLADGHGGLSKVAGAQLPGPGREGEPSRASGF